MREQAERFGTEFVDDDVVEVDLSSRPSRSSPPSATWQARAIVVATGASAQLLGLETERRLLGRGVSTCATCDGFFFKGQDSCVVGGGDSAMEEAHLPDEVRQQGDDRPPAGHAPRVQDHAGPGAPEPEGRRRLWNREVDEILGTDQGHRRPPPRHPTTGATEEVPPAASSWRSGTRPTPSSSRGSSTWTRRIPGHRVRLDAHERRRGLRGRRRGGPRLPPGGDGRGHGLHGGDRRRALPRGRSAPLGPGMRPGWTG